MSDDPAHEKGVMHRFYAIIDELRALGYDVEVQRPET